MLYDVVWGANEENAILELCAQNDLERVTSLAAVFCIP